MNVLEIDYDQILEEAYLKHKKLIVCFDFDNTVYDYHKKDINYSPIIELLMRCQLLGFEVNMFSSPNDRMTFAEKEDYCQNIGIICDNVNSASISLEGDKPYANIYLDDKAGLLETYTRLNKLVTKIENEQL